MLPKASKPAIDMNWQQLRQRIAKVIDGERDNERERDAEGIDSAKSPVVNYENYNHNQITNCILNHNHWPHGKPNKMDTEFDTRQSTLDTVHINVTYAHTHIHTQT